MTSSARHRQEADIAAAEDRERAAAAAARAARLAAAKAEVDAAAAEDAARVAAADLKALRGGSVGSGVSADGNSAEEPKPEVDAARERTAQWAAAHPHGRGGGSPDGRGRAGGAPGRGARGGRAPGDEDWVDEERSLHRRRGSPSPDRRRGRHHGIHTVVRDVGPGGGWPTLTKTNYIEWASVMKIRLRVRHLWDAVRYGAVDFDEDTRALDALIVVVPPEMQFSLANKDTAKEAWDAIAASRIGSDRARESTLQALRKEWESLAFKPGEDIDDFALRLGSLLQKLAQYGDDNYD